MYVQTQKTHICAERNKVYFFLELLARAVDMDYKREGMGGPTELRWPQPPGKAWALLVY